MLNQALLFPRSRKSPPRKLQLHRPRRAAKSVESRSQGFIIGEPTGDASIRPFSFQASDDDLADLKRRIKATRWPERELVNDGTQGVQLALMQKLAEYWATDYDWRRCEAQLNALPNFITEIDGLDIHFIHVRSKHENALPVIVTHGWPGSPIEQLKIIGPLTDPHGLRRHRRGRVRRGDSVGAGLRVLGQAHYARLGPGANGACLDRSDEAPRIRPFRRARRRLGCVRNERDGPTGSSGVDRHSCELPGQHAV